MLTIFGNFRINSLSRLEHLKSSFQSFKSTSDNWLINVRGTYREEAINYLKSELGEKMRQFSLLDDSRGWITNSLDMLKEAKYDYVLVWNEDHINISPTDYFLSVVREMRQKKVDYLPYSWWMFGKANAYDITKNDADWKTGKTIDSILMKRSNWLNIKKAGYPYYLVSMCGIFRKDFLEKMWRNDNNRLPLSFKKVIFKIFGLLTKTKIISPYGHKVLFEKINSKIFFNKLRKYPSVTPFEMEKGPERYDILPLTIAYPKRELFACIDDNVNEIGYSLVERGLYKSNNFKDSHKENIKNILIEINTVLSKIDENEVDEFVRNILSARKIIACGAGRVGMAVKGFVMRLKHLGLDAYVLGDANVPALKQEDLFLVCSGSGETQTIYELTLIAQRNLANINLITGNRNSRMGKIAHKVVEIKAPSKTKQVDNFTSIQPMTTLNEQCLAIFFDAVVLRLMKELNETHDTMWARHSNLE